MSESTAKYSPIDEVDEESLEKLLGQSLYDNPESESERPLLKRRWHRLWPWLANGVLFCVSIALFVLSFRRTNNVQCGKQLSTFSPAFEAIEYQPILFNGTFNFPSIYRGHPTAEIDAAWNRISTGVKPTRISRDVLEKIGKRDRPSSVKFRDEDGGGYMVSLEVTHQLHCLNMLRKYVYHEYYESWDPSFLAKPEVFRTHLDHCVEMIRQNIMCHGDVGLITYEWVKGFSLPYPDFNTLHQCRNFDKILDWSYAHEIHIPRNHVTRWGDEVDLPEAP
ncbi:hypothetical protein AcV7_009811 [Taiwanofungus camphoratus]|nr:hypothetical protein AcV7_009811 [Antrodia cinnamomea]